VLSAFDSPLIKVFKNSVEPSQPDDDSTPMKMISIVKVLNQSVRDAETYRMLPLDLRKFLESNSEAMYALSRRLKEAVNARYQVIAMRDYIEVAKGNEGQCFDCKIIEAIEAIVNSSFLDLSP